MAHEQAIDEALWMWTTLAFVNQQLLKHAASVMHGSPHLLPAPLF